MPVDNVAKSAEAAKESSVPPSNEEKRSTVTDAVDTMAPSAQSALPFIEPLAPRSQSVKSDSDVPGFIGVERGGQAGSEFVFRTPSERTKQALNRRVTSAGPSTHPVMRCKTPRGSRSSLILRTLSPEEG